MEKKCFISEENIQGIDPKKLTKIIIEDSNKRRWAIKDRFNNTTPFFKNESKIITKPQYDFLCVFVGEKEGIRSIYYVTPGNQRETSIYGKVDFGKRINRIHNLENDNKNILVYLQGNYGEEVCLFDVDRLKRNSDTFDALYVGEGVPEKSHLFLKTVELYGEKRMYMGMVDENGKIGKSVYDIYHHTSTNIPIITTEDGYDVLDTKSIKAELSKEIKPHSINIDDNAIRQVIKLNTVFDRTQPKK